FPIDAFEKLMPPPAVERGKIVSLRPAICSAPSRNLDFLYIDRRFVRAGTNFSDKRIGPLDRIFLFSLFKRRQSCYPDFVSIARFSPRGQFASFHLCGNVRENRGVVFSKMPQLRICWQCVLRI